MSVLRFSVIVPTRNNERDVGAAIESVLAQLHGDYELLVSDDGSTDSTVSVVERFAARDRRVRLLCHDGARGPGANRNFAIRHCAHAWIAFLDGDDVWTEDHLSSCAEAISAFPDARLIFGDYRRFASTIRDAAAPALEGKSFFAEGAAYVEMIKRSRAEIAMYGMHSRFLLKHCCLRYCPISTQAVVLSRATLQANGISFREDWLINEDFHVWMRMLECGQAVALRSVQFYYRSNPSGLTSDPIRYLEGMARSHEEWLRRITPMLSQSELDEYRSKIAGFLRASAFQHSIQGRLGAACSAEARALRFRRGLHELAGMPKTIARSIWRKLKPTQGNSMQPG